MAEARILIVDDEPGMLEVCADTLAALDGVRVEVEQESPRAAERLAAESWDLLIADVRMPGLNGVDLLQRARETDPDLLVLMLTAFPSVETAVESMKLGAADYLTKPFLPDELRGHVRRLIQEKRLRDENRLLRRQVEGTHRMGEMIGRSPPMQAVFDTIERIAPADIDVLILGETGTGKELVARSIHARSPRRKQRFVPVDCGAIPEDLLESEFFGHERGAFTGATARSMGLLEFAHKGTFFLDEVGHLPVKLQAKLLRSLQERRIRRVGGTQEIDLDVRIIAATSRDLEAEVSRERFRMDLYYRINVARVELPPLRNRPGDVPLMASHFLERYAREMGREGVEVDADVFELLACYGWPGNVRELQNAVKRALAMARRETLTVDDLPDEIVSAAGNRADANGASFFSLRDQHVAAFERRYLSDLLATHEGDVAEAAGEARLPRGTLYRLLKKNDINPNDFR